MKFFKKQVGLPGALEKANKEFKKIGEKIKLFIKI